MSNDRILIVKLSAIGDVIHTLPCLNVLRQARPDAQIGWIVQEPAAQLLRHHPQIDHLIIYPRREWSSHPLRFLRKSPAFIRELRSYDFNIAIDFQGLTKSGALARLSGAKHRIGYGDHDGRELNKRFTNDRVTPGPERVHTLERNLALLKPLGIDVKTADGILPIPDEARAAIDHFWAESQISPSSRVIALNPGAGWITKRWPLDFFADLGKKISQDLGETVLLLWGPGEHDMVKEIARNMEESFTEVLVAPPTTLMTLAALLSRCAAVVAGDTGPLHMAAMLKVPCVAIFGASDGKRNGPYGDNCVVLQNNDLECVPCWKKKCSHRPIYECLRAITPEDAFNAVSVFLQNT